MLTLAALCCSFAEASQPRLSALAFDAGVATLSPAFDPDVLSYTAGVSHGTYQVFLDYTTEDDPSTLTVSASTTSPSGRRRRLHTLTDAQSLAVGPNDITLTLTRDADGESRAYVVTVTRHSLASRATLQSRVFPRRGPPPRRRPRLGIHSLHLRLRREHPPRPLLAHPPPDGRALGVHRSRRRRVLGDALRLGRRRVGLARVFPGGERRRTRRPRRGRRHHQHVHRRRLPRASPSAASPAERAESSSRAFAAHASSESESSSAAAPPSPPPSPPPPSPSPPRSRRRPRRRLPPRRHRRRRSRRLHRPWDLRSSGAPRLGPRVLVLAAAGDSTDSCLASVTRGNPPTTSSAAARRASPRPSARATGRSARRTSGSRASGETCDATCGGAGTQTRAVWCRAKEPSSTLGVFPELTRARANALSSAPGFSSAPSHPPPAYADQTPADTDGIGAEGRVVPDAVCVAFNATATPRFEPARAGRDPMQRITTGPRRRGTRATRGAGADRAGET